MSSELYSSSTAASGGAGWRLHSGWGLFVSVESDPATFLICFKSNNVIYLYDYHIYLYTRPESNSNSSNAKRLIIASDFD